MKKPLILKTAPLTGPWGFYRVPINPFNSTWSQTNPTEPASCLCPNKFLTSPSKTPDNHLKLAHTTKLVPWHLESGISKIFKSKLPWIHGLYCFDPINDLKVFWRRLTGVAPEKGHNHSKSIKQRSNPLIWFIGGLLTIEPKWRISRPITDGILTSSHGEQGADGTPQPSEGS